MVRSPRARGGRGARARAARCQAFVRAEGVRAGLLGPGMAEHPRLTWRELRVLTLLAQRLSPGEIAVAERIARSTVYSAIGTLHEKLGTASDQHLACTGVRHEFAGCCVPRASQSP
jgi:DNA-binding CsgD family transcriptional regulator